MEIDEEYNKIYVVLSERKTPLSSGMGCFIMPR